MLTPAPRSGRLTAGSVVRAGPVDRQLRAQESLYARQTPRDEHTVSDLAIWSAIRDFRRCPRRGHFRSLRLRCDTHFQFSDLSKIDGPSSSMKTGPTRFPVMAALAISSCSLATSAQICRGLRIVSAGCGYCGIRLYTRGVIPTMRLNVLMKAPTLL